MYCTSFTVSNVVLELSSYEKIIFKSINNEVKKPQFQFIDNTNLIIPLQLNKTRPGRRTPDLTLPQAFSLK